MHRIKQSTDPEWRYNFQSWGAFWNQPSTLLAALNGLLLHGWFIRWHRNTPGTNRSNDLDLWYYWSPEPEQWRLFLRLSQSPEQPERHPLGGVRHPLGGEGQTRMTVFRAPREASTWWRGPNTCDGQSLSLSLSLFLFLYIYISCLTDQFIWSDGSNICSGMWDEIIYIYISYAWPIHSYDRTDRTCVLECGVGLKVPPDFSKNG